MKKDINKRIILIAALACICLIVIVATLVFVADCRPKRTFVPYSADT